MTDQEDPNDTDLLEDDSEIGDELTNTLRESWDKLAADGDDDDDLGGIDAEMGAVQADEVVPAEKGSEIAREAQVRAPAKKAKEPAAAEGAEPEPEKAKPEPEKTDDEGQGEADAEDAAPDLTSAPVADLMRGVPQRQRGEIVRRMQESATALAPIKKIMADPRMEGFGKDPATVAAQLANFAQSAAEDPTGYMTWFAGQAAGDDATKAAEILSAVAKHYGLQVSAAKDEDDPFEDEETAKLRRENERLRAQVEGRAVPQSGPMSPARQAQLTAEARLNRFVNELDQDGNPRRPNFLALSAEIGRVAQAEMSKKGRALTDDEVDHIYRLVESQVAPRATQATFAAQQAAPVQQQKQARTTAGEKAARASKLIDGSGQGASRRPALKEGASPEEILRSLLGSQPG